MLSLETISPSEYAGYFSRYVTLVPTVDFAADPADNELLDLAAGLTPAQLDYRYAPGKWTIPQQLIHLLDSERVFAYRALRFARADRTPLPGFEQDDYVAATRAHLRPLPEIIDDYRAQRASTLRFFASLSPTELSRTGPMGGTDFSVRALALTIMGHEQWHLNLIRERYL